MLDLARPASGPSGIAAAIRAAATGLRWPLAALGVLLAFNLAFTGNFFHLEWRDGHCYGVLVDILNHGSRVMLLALGMTLVIATGGVDLSVGATMAIAGAVAVQLIAQAGFGFWGAAGAALALAGVAGAWNGLLVGWLRLQPIVATLVLMVAGRGIAQVVTDGAIITFTPAPAFERFAAVLNGHWLGLPTAVAVVAAVLAAMALATRRTALGLFIAAVGDNERACRFAGLDARAIKCLAYLASGLCAGLAGLLAAANIRCADAGHAGLGLELDAILAVVLGGTALTGGRFSLLGSIVGALVIQTLTTTLAMHNVSSDIAPLPKAVVILAICLLHAPDFRAQAGTLLARLPGGSTGGRSPAP